MLFHESLGRIFHKLINIFKSKILFKIFLAFILATSVPAGIMLSVSFLNTNSIVKTDFISYKENMNIQVYKNIDENLSTMQLQSQSLIYNISNIKTFLDYRNNTIDENYIVASDNVTYYLTSVLSINNRYDGIGLLDNEGYWTKFVNTGGLVPKGNSLKDKDWIKKTLNAKGSPQIFILDLTEYATSTALRSSLGTVIAVTRTLIDYKNSYTPIGVSIFTQSLPNFGNIVTTNCISAGETMIILDENNDIIFSNKDIKANTNSLVSSTLSAANSKSKQFNMESEGFLVIYNASSKFGFKVLSLIPKSIVESKSSPVKNINTALFIILCIFALLISIFLSKLIINPLKRLMNSFKKLEAGDFDTRVLFKGKDEFAEICKSFNGMVLNVNNLIKQKYELDIYRKQSDIEALQSKINPHFLYNTLSSIKSVIEKQDYDNASQMVQDLSDIFRYSLNRGIFVVTLKDEIDYVKKYISLQKLRFGDAFDTVFDIDADIIQCNILRLTIQPLVENALLHGFEGKTDKGIINISAKSFTNQIYVYVEDNGVGITQTKLEEINALLEENPDIVLDNAARKLVGIFNVNSRIKLYFGNDYGIKLFSSEGQGVTVRMTLPLETNRRGES